MYIAAIFALSPALKLAARRSLRPWIVARSSDFAVPSRLRTTSPSRMTLIRLSASCSVEVIGIVRRLRPFGVVVCLFDGQTKLAQEVVNDLRAFLDKSRGQPVPWADARVFDTKIRRNVKLAECPSHGKSIFRYAPNCPGATDYAALANEVIGAVVVDSVPAPPPVPVANSVPVTV